MAGLFGETIQALFDNPLVKVIPGILLGTFLIYMGLKQWGIQFKNTVINLPYINKLLHLAYQRSEGQQRSLIIGLLSAFLPCGFLYSVLISLAVFHDPFIGLIGMLSFCLGTIPILLLSPQLAKTLLSPLKNHSQTLASLLLISLGLVTIFYRVFTYYESVIQCQ